MERFNYKEKDETNLNAFEEERRVGLASVRRGTWRRLANVAIIDVAEHLAPRIWRRIAAIDTDVRMSGRHLLD